MTLSVERSTAAPLLQWVSVGKTAKPSAQCPQVDRPSNGSTCTEPWELLQVDCFDGGEKRGWRGGYKWVLRAICALELCPLGFSWGIWAWMPLAVDLYSFPLKIYLFAGGTEAVGWSGALYQGIYSLVYREKKTLFRSVIVLRYISIFIGQYFRVLVTASDPPTWPQAHRFGAYWDKKEPNEFRYLGSNSAASPQKLWHCGVLCHWKSISDT